MKAAIHPDRGGEPTPVLALPPTSDRATRGSIEHLYDLRIRVERELAAGPWDKWDAQVLDQWLRIVKEQIRAAWSDLEMQHPEPRDYDEIGMPFA